jgi:general secretion pathway protein C
VPAEIMPEERVIGFRKRFSLSRAVTPRLPMVVSALLVILIARQLADLIWSVWPRSSPSSPTTIVERARPPDRGVPATSAEYSRVVAAHLFGEVLREGAAETAEPPVDAPETTLALTLTGILYDEGGFRSAAIISGDRGDEESYAIGAAIGAFGATLRAIYSDSVIIENAGRLETLRQPLELSGAAPAAVTATRSAARSQEGEPFPARLGEVVQAAPFQDGRVTGLRVAPASDAAQFEALGFRTGDIVTAVDGEFLEEGVALLDAIPLLLDASYVSLALIRDGAPTALTVDINSMRVADAD